MKPHTKQTKPPKLQPLFSPDNGGVFAETGVVPVRISDNPITIFARVIAKVFNFVQGRKIELVDEQATPEPTPKRPNLTVIEGGNNSPAPVLVVVPDDTDPIRAA